MRRASRVTTTRDRLLIEFSRNSRFTSMRFPSRFLLIFATVLIASLVHAQVLHNVSGRLLFATTKGWDPGAYIPVQLASDQNSWTSSLQYTDREGSYFFRGVRSGSYVLSIWPGEKRQIKCPVRVPEQPLSITIPSITIPSCPRDQGQFSSTQTTSSVVIVNKNSGLALDVPDGSADDHVVIQQFPVNKGANQAWIITKVGNAYTIMSQASRKCLDVPNASTANGVQVQQFGCHGGLNQQWTFSSAGSGYYYIRNINSGLYLDIRASSRAAHAQLEQLPYNGGGDDQKWILLQNGRPVSPP
jgi:ricin-type beta-trefoil lectin protein